MIALMVLLACGPKKGSDLPAAGSQETPTADELFDRLIEASGGSEALSGYDSVVSRGRATVAAQGLTMSMTIYQQAPDLMYSVMELPGLGRFEAGYDGEVVWEINPMMGPRIKEGAEAAQERRRGDIRATLRYAEHYPTRETVGLVEYAGRQAWKVQATTPEGTAESLYFDPQSGLMWGTETVVETDMGRLPMAMVFKAYGEFEGVKIPTVIEQVAGPVKMELTIDEVIFDPPDLPSLAAPEAIQALKGER